MSDPYARQRASSQRMLQAKGQPMTMTRKGVEGYDYDTSTVIPGADLTQTASGVALDCTEREIDGTNILRGDKNVILPAVAGMWTPNVGDSIAISGVAYRVMHSNPLAPAGVPIIHQLRVRA